MSLSRVKCLSKHLSIIGEINDKNGVTKDLEKEMKRLVQKICARCFLQRYLHRDSVYYIP